MSQLTPCNGNTTSFLLDTGAFLETVRNISPVPPDAYLVSFDVKDLYTSIPHTNGIQSVRWLLTTNHMNPDLSDLCCELLSIVLNNNFFLFEDTYYLQIKGSAMGSNVAPPYANAYMAHYEDTSIYTQDLFRSHALTWKRYIDDVFCVWGGDLRTLQAFFQVLRTSWPGLDFTMTYDTHQISFLDTLVIKDDNGNLSTDLYSKPTDRNSLLHYSSFHPKNMIKSIPKSQLNRVSKIVSDPATKDLRTTEMRSKFRERGYPPRMCSLYTNSPPPRHITSPLVFHKVVLSHSLLDLCPQRTNGFSMLELAAYDLKNYHTDEGPVSTETFVIYSLQYQDPRISPRKDFGFSGVVDAAPLHDVIIQGPAVPEAGDEMLRQSVWRGYRVDIFCKRAEKMEVCSNELWMRKLIMGSG
ncbi:unnamed protein product [Ranitomeya imitator]|uniref:Reverse transcriptase domain-containing protein n=1 Tax=Ranitomeya imitator TaxID=111125 RepID=A0ABN9KT45_9NEOB|nr:unnamed protein product [Ranitomeya imitator]